MNKLIVLLLAAVCAAGAWADVSVVREWQPKPGRAAEMMKAAVEAQAIHTKLGAKVFIGTDPDGHMHYVLTFPDWSAWAKFGTAIEGNADWRAFMSKYGTTDPNATSIGVTFLEQPLVAKTLPVTIVYGWKVNPGRGADFMALAREAAAIHTKLGASPGISVDDLGNVWYETAFDSWAAWAAYDAALAKSEEWAAFIDKATKMQTATLMRVIRIQQYKPPM